MAEVNDYTKTNFWEWLQKWLLVLLILIISILTVFIIPIDLKTKSICIEIGNSIFSGIIFFYLIYFVLFKLKKLNKSLWKLKDIFFRQRKNFFSKQDPKDEYLFNEYEKKVFKYELKAALKLQTDYFKQFKFLFLTYLLLYILLTILDCLGENETKKWNQILEIIAFTLNNAGCWFLFTCFAILYIPTKRHRTKEIQNNLFIFSGFIFLSLSVVYIFSIYKTDNKQIFDSDEIGIISSENFTKDSLKIYDKPIQIKSIVKESKFIKDSIGASILKDSTFKLALKKSSLSKNTVIQLPQWIHVGNDSNLVNQIEITIDSNRCKDSFHLTNKKISFYINTKASDSIIYTNFNLRFCKNAIPKDSLLRSIKAYYKTTSIYASANSKKLKAVYEINFTNACKQLDTSFKLALRIPSYSDDTSISHSENALVEPDIHLPGWMVISNYSSNIIGLQIKIDSIAFIDTLHKIDTSDKKIIFPINSLSTDSLILTDLKVTFNKDSLKNVTTLTFPRYIKLYREENKDTINKLFEIISGLINALVFALLIGRLDSRFIGIGKIWIIFLFFYPAIQPLYIYLTNDLSLSTTLKPIVIGFALILKVLLFLVNLYILQSGRLLTYFFCFKELDKKADAVFDNQFEFVVYKDEHHNNFSFAIYYKSKKILQSLDPYSTPDTCKNWLEEFQNDLKNNSNVIDKSFTGLSNWININNTIYSKSFSEEEAAKLVIEMKEKLPYCKIVQNI